MILVGGGSRSGKTRFALQLAEAAGPRLAYLATAALLDDGMRERARMHRAERGDRFVTLEEADHPADLIVREASRFDAIVVDCLTLWISNRMLAGVADMREEAEAFASASSGVAARVILVTNEVGAGIVPDNELAIRFRDQAGWVNQIFATQASEVWWTVFGCPLKVKG
ncbi:MAG: bifunctional adenosylcobinamide kinase/adenosylcobinamide-phosphate guanylyltransferase [Bryobacterales bacterium]|nr:bifunctional adenosylcobinamide kinase/adenosylcobinamide-phosphate guanylyltransferase [Bryobacterales bacterium]